MAQFSSSGFETILNPINKCPYTGRENVRHLGNGTKLYSDNFGSERFVLYVKRVPVSALQIMTNNNISTVANVITLKEHRKKGYAKQLWETAKQMHPVISHSPHLSEDGRIFATKCN